MSSWAYSSVSVNQRENPLCISQHVNRLDCPERPDSKNEWVFEWLLLWQACCDRITHSVEQIGPWVPDGPRGLSTAPRLRLFTEMGFSQCVCTLTNTDCVCNGPNVNAAILLAHCPTQGYKKKKKKILACVCARCMKCNEILNNKMFCKCVLGTFQVYLVC